jgi:hypothetical protein
VKRLTTPMGGPGSKTLKAFDGGRCNRATPSDWIAVPTSDHLWATEREGDVVLATIGDGTFVKVHGVGVALHGGQQQGLEPPQGLFAPRFRRRPLVGGGRFGVVEVHDLHIRAMSTTATALTRLVMPINGCESTFLGDVCKKLELDVPAEARARCGDEHPRDAPVASAANRNDFKLTRETLESVVIARPKATSGAHQGLLDKGYDYREVRELAHESGPSHSILPGAGQVVRSTHEKAIGEPFRAAHWVRGQSPLPPQPKSKLPPSP